VGLARQLDQLLAVGGRRLAVQEQSEALQVAGVVATAAEGCLFGVGAHSDHLGPAVIGRRLLSRYVSRSFCLVSGIANGRPVAPVTDLSEAYVGLDRS
jgi:hypothetical protein